MAVSIAEELGIDKSNSPLSTSSSIFGEQVNLGDAWRTWFSCYLLCASLGVCIRVLHQISWSKEDDSKLVALEYGMGKLTSDTLLCQLVRAERLCDQIASQSGFYDSNSVAQVTDFATMQRLQNYMTDWKAQMPPLLSSPGLKCYEHIATIFLHECVLHTPANKHSFAAPYVAERLSVTDFPAPIVAEEHIISLHALKDAIHMLLDLFASFDVTELKSLPTLFVARSAYAQWVLIKLYIAATALGNTYGAFIDAQSLQVEHYLGKTVEIGETFAKVDAECISAQIYLSSHRLKEWFLRYKASHANQDVLFANCSTVSSLEPSSLDLATNSIDWTAFGLANDAYQYGLEDLFGEY